MLDPISAVYITLYNHATNAPPVRGLGLAPYLKKTCSETSTISNMFCKKSSNNVLHLSYSILLYRSKQHRLHRHVQELTELLCMCPPTGCARSLSTCGLSLIASHCRMAFWAIEGSGICFAIFNIDIVSVNYVLVSS